MSAITATAASPLPRRISPSAIVRYRSCPRAAWFQYVARVPRVEQPNAALVLGNALHAALERFLGLPPADREPAPEILARCLRSVWPKHRVAGAFLSRDEEADWGRQGLRMLAAFAERFDTTVVPLGREQWVSTRLPSGVEIYGKVDRIDGSPSDVRDADVSDSALRIVDYKTGRHQIDSQDLPDEPAVQAYILAVEDRYKRPVGRMRFIYLASSDDVWCDVEREDVEFAREALTSAAAVMYADREFAPTPGDHCARCAYAHVCPDAGRVDLVDIVVDDDLAF